MGKISIKVLVGGRTYPLTVSENEQEKVMKAAEDINKGIELLRQNYGVKDPQDLLAMTALQLVSKGQSGTPKSEVVAVPADYGDIELALENLSKQINELK
ncbi:MAG: cell division protein ZapA [Crocinitomicaceae bacterium]|jgi:cell division protein ZapA (FtsZ GTPase activity inhibitor)